MDTLSQQTRNAL